ncbi:MAG: four helix bundle protein [Elusimicrobia bacterium]|nr:four helix bundle protein [Elusimicrobiota bacterium]
MKSYKDLEIWKKSIDLVKTIYKLTENFPEKETYSLTSQLRRSAVSVPSNIAEGQARKHTKEFLQFLYHALGSLAELNTQTIIAKDIGYLSEENFEIVEARITEIQKMVYAIISKLSTTIHSPLITYH